MTPDDLKKRTRTFAVDVVKLAKELPRDPACIVLARQLVRSGTSVGANYRASCRAKSRADFISKMTTVEEEADEVAYWLTILAESGTIRRERIASLLEEADQLTRIIVASIKTTRRNSNP